MAMGDEIRQLKQAYRKEKNGDVSKRLQLMLYVKIDWMAPSKAADTMHRARSWGLKWNKRYEEGGINGLQDKPRSGRPTAVHRGMLKRVRKMARKTRVWTAEEMSDFIFEKTGHRYELSHVRKIMKKWGYTMKAAVFKHARRPGNRRIRRFQAKAKDAIVYLESEGYTTCIQDESIFIAGARARREVYTLKNERAVYTYTGSHDKTIVFGLITNDGEGYFERHEKFTKDEFKSFLKNACQKFGKLLMILDRAPQHKAKAVRDAPEELDGQVKLLFLPAGCPDLSAIEELWRQMKMAVLTGPYVKFKMYTDIDEWLDQRLPSLDIYKYIYRSI